MKRTPGFSLVELLVVIAIIGILTALAVPSLREYRIKANRSAAKSAVLELASRQKQYFIDARRFTASSVCNATVLGYTVPSEVANTYCITITAPALVPPEFTIKAEPIAGSIQDGDGSLTVDHKGTKTGKW